MSEIVTVENDLPLFDLSEPESCFHNNCPNKAYILVVVDQAYLRAMGIPELPTETIKRVWLCRVHYEEYKNFRKTSSLKAQRRINSEEK